MTGLILDLFVAFFGIGILTFGGGYAMIPLIQRIVIARHGWLTTTQFLDVVGIAGMAPGPIAVNSATFVGYKVAGVPGSIAAMLGVVMPSMIIVLAIAGVFYRLRNHPLFTHFAAGLRMAVVALIAAAVITVGKASIFGWKDAALAGAVVALLLRTRTHPIVVIGLAAAAGLLLF